MADLVTQCLKRVVIVHPREHIDGTKGQEVKLWFELKLIADVGLVGHPNAGKSTLLAGLSNARPKIAPYPFTTLIPQRGMVQFDDYTSFSIADIPGLIEGAHKNRGLGLNFLRHIERTHVLCYLLDCTEEDPDRLVENFNVLLNELEHYKAYITSKPSVVILNKIDLIGTEAGNNIDRNVDLLKQEISNLNVDLPVFEISARERQGLGPLALKLKELVEKAAGERKRRVKTVQIVG